MILKCLWNSQRFIGQRYLVEPVGQRSYCNVAPGSDVSDDIAHDFWYIQTWLFGSRRESSAAQQAAESGDVIGKVGVCAI